MLTNKLAGGRARNPEEVREIFKCRASFKYFCETYVKIRSLGATEMIPFKLHPFQVIAADAFVNNENVVCLKPRQMGLSTLIQAFILWECLFWGNREQVVVSIKHNTAKKFLYKIKLMYKELPDFLRVRVTNGNSRDVGSADRMMFANGSNITVMGSTEDAARSESITRLVIDEAAFQRYAETMWGAAAPALQHGGKSIILSTAYGMGNFFHKTWTEAVAGVNGFVPIQLTYDMWPRGPQLSYSVNDDETRSLIRQQQKEAQDAWLQKQIRLMGQKRVDQEILCNFLKSGDSVFDIGAIREIDMRLQETLPVETRSYYGQDDAVLIYERPIPGFQYFIGADIATGRSIDFTAISIYRINYDAQESYRYVEVACGKLKCDVIEAAELLYELGKHYNFALIAPEVNGVGEGTAAHLQHKGYPNLYYHESITTDANGEKVIQKRPGFNNDVHIKRNMVALMAASLNAADLKVLIQNPFFVSQAYSFVYDTTGNPRALNKRGKSAGATMYTDDDGDDRIDDSILSSCIAMYVCANHRSYPTYTVAPAWAA